MKRTVVKRTLNLKQLAGKGQQAADPGVLRELRLLRTRVPQVTGAVVVGADGALLAEDAPAADAGHLAARTAATLAAALLLAETAERGRFRELLVRGEEGYAAVYTAGPAAVLAVLAEPGANVGRIHLEARRSGARIAALTDGATGRPEDS